MVRNYTQNDIEEIIRIYTLEYKAMPEEIETLKGAENILVYDDNGIQGFMHLVFYGESCAVEMGAVSNEVIKSVGFKLWEEAKKLFKENSTISINTYHVKDNVYWKEFFDEVGFKYWYSIYRFNYQGKNFNEPELCVKKYEDKYYIDKISLESEAFSKLREKHDIKPYNWYLAAGEKNLEANRKWTLGEKEYIYLFFENEEIIGASMVKNAEVDLLFVNVKYQGKGYGRRILEFTINRGLEQNPNGVSLNALAGNEEALRLYKNVGFKVIQAQDCRRLLFSK